MNARALIGAGALLLAIASQRSIGFAEQLQRLHVTSLGLSADVPHPGAGERFHLILALHVREPNLHAQNVQLPSFDGLEELGDERSSVSGPHGTDYRETLTLVASSAGTFHVSPASFDAIDAGDGRPKRFVSNALTIIVGRSSGRAVGARAARAALVIAAALALPVLAWFAFARRVPKAENPPAERVTTAVPQPEDERLRAAWLDLRERRDRPSALALRSALWRAAGAAAGDTLAGVLQRPEARDARTRTLLASVERAAFVHDEGLPKAISQLIAEAESQR